MMPDGWRTPDSKENAGSAFAESAPHYVSHTRGRNNVAPKTSLSVVWDDKLCGLYAQNVYGRNYLFFVPTEHWAIPHNTALCIGCGALRKGVSWPSFDSSCLYPPFLPRHLSHPTLPYVLTSPRSRLSFACFALLPCLIFVRNVWSRQWVESTDTRNLFILKSLYTREM